MASGSKWSSGGTLRPGAHNSIAVSTQSHWNKGISTPTDMFSIRFHLACMNTTILSLYKPLSAQNMLFF